MIKKKIGIFVLFVFLTSSIFGAVNAMGAFIEPIDPIDPIDPIKPPPPPPPTTTTVSGYVKESGTNNGIYNARVVLYGWEFVIDMYQKVQVGVKYTNSYGYYSFTGVTADSPYSLLVTKSGYSGYSGSYRNPVYLTYLYCSLRVTGTVLEDDTLDNIKSPNVDPLTLDITPPDSATYSHVISTATTKVTIYDCYGTAVKTVTCSSSSGAYDTGTFTIRKGTVRISAYTQPGLYASKNIYHSISSSTTLSGQNLNLERNQGLVSAYGDEHLREEMNNFFIKLHTRQPLEEVSVNLEARCAPQLTYDPLYSGAKYNYLETNYDLTTYDEWTTILDHNYWTPRYATQKLYVYNHWTGDESIISVDDLDSGITQEGSFSLYTWTLGTKVGFSGGGEGNPLSSEFSVSATYTPPDYIDIFSTYVPNDLTNGRYLGEVNVDYTNAVLSRHSKMSNVWHLKMDNSLMKSAKQCGSHFTFKVVTEINYWLCKAMPWGNWWLTDYCTISFEQTLGDGDPTGIGDNSPPPHPVVSLLSGSYLDIEYGEMHGYDLWMNLLAGEISESPV